MKTFPRFPRHFRHFAQIWHNPERHTSFILCQFFCLNYLYFLPLFRFQRQLYYLWIKLYYIYIIFYIDIYTECQSNFLAKLVMNWWMVCLSGNAASALDVPSGLKRNAPMSEPSPTNENQMSEPQNNSRHAVDFHSLFLGNPFGFSVDLLLQCLFDPFCTATIYPWLFIYRWRRLKWRRFLQIVASFTLWLCGLFMLVVG